MLSISKICLLGCIFRQNIDTQSEARAVLLQKERGKMEKGCRDKTPKSVTPVDYSFKDTV